MRRGIVVGTALLLMAGLAYPLAPQAQGQAPEVIRGTRRNTPQPPPAAAPQPGTEPAAGNASYQQGVKFLEARDFNKAINAFQQALKANPQSAETYYSLAQAFNAQGDQDKAIRNLQAALRLKPNFSPARVSLGQIYSQRGLDLLRQGKADQAEALLKDAIAQDPKNDVAFNTLGVALAQQGRYRQAIAALQRAATLNPNNTQAQFNLGVAQYSMGNKDATVQQYAILTFTDPAAADRLFRIIQGTSQVATPFRF
jgi:tetratricopeptide (TPR) repeat protein